MTQKQYDNIMALIAGLECVVRKPYGCGTAGSAVGLALELGIVQETVLDELGSIHGVSMIDLVDQFGLGSVILNKIFYYPRGAMVEITSWEVAQKLRAAIANAAPTPA